MTEPAVLQQVYDLLDTVTPLATDCGRACDGRCCRPAAGGRSGMLLLPGEERYLAERAERLGTSLTQAGLTVMQTAGGCLLTCSGCCDRRLRPIACRIFPLYPQIGADGRVRARYDPRAWAECPLVREQAHVRLERPFVRAVRRCGRILLADPAAAAALRALSSELDALQGLLPTGSARAPIARRRP